MIEDGTLFDPAITDDRPPHQRSAWESFKNHVGKARSEHPDTSHAAARLVAPKTGTWRQKVLNVIAAHEEGMTDEDICIRLHLDPSTERPRRVELTEAGWICDSGLRRRTRSGHQAVVWVLSERGKGAL